MTLLLLLGRFAILSRSVIVWFLWYTYVVLLSVLLAIFKQPLYVPLDVSLNVVSPISYQLCFRMLSLLLLYNVNDLESNGPLYK